MLVVGVELAEGEVFAAEDIGAAVVLTGATVVLPCILLPVEVIIMEELCEDIMLDVMEDMVLLWPVMVEEWASEVAVEFLVEVALALLWVCFASVSLVINDMEMRKQKNFLGFRLD